MEARNYELERELVETAGEPDGDGEWCVYWSTVTDDAHVAERYATRAAAEAAAELSNIGLRLHNHGRLLCGFVVRRLEDGEWMRVEESD